MRAALRRRQADVFSKPAHVDRRGDHADVAEARMMHRRRHAEMAHLRIGEYLVDLVDRPAWDSGALEQLDPVLGGLMPGDIPDRRVDGGAVGAAALLVLPLGLVLPLRAADSVAQSLKHPRGARRDVDVAVAGREYAGGDAGRMIVAGLRCNLAADEPARGLEVEHENLRFE